MIVVLDTNIFVAALLNPLGAPAKTRKYWQQGQLDVLVSDPILDEYFAVLSQAPDVSEIEAAILLSELKTFAHHVEINGSLQVCKDSDDDKFLETALEGRADFLVTKNLKHFPRKSYEDVRIVNVATFLKELEKVLP